MLNYIIIIYAFTNKQNIGIYCKINFIRREKDYNCGPIDLNFMC